MHKIRMNFSGSLGSGIYATEPLFDHITDIVHFIKDHEGRYVMVNSTLANRLGLKDKSELVGKLPSDVFPAPLGEAYRLQDKEIMLSGIGVHGQLELHLYTNKKRGWAVTYKEPIFDESNKVIGICGLSRDLSSTHHASADLDKIHSVLDHIHSNLNARLIVPDLAASVDLSPYQLDKHIKSIYGLSTSQYIIQSRIEKACKLLKTNREEIVNIALDCGYSDQSAFTRQFKSITGITPKAYRQQVW